MRSVGGAGFVIIGFLLLYMAISGKLDCFFTFVQCLFGTPAPATTTASNSGSGSTADTVNSIVNGLSQGLKNVPTFINFAG